MTTSIAITGRGGQGGKLVGELLAWSASNVGLTPTLYSVYSALIRGGDIASFLSVDEDDPGVAQRGSYDLMLALHNNWFDRYSPQIRPGGVLVYDGRFITRRLVGQLGRADVVLLDAPLKELTQKTGDPRSSSMVAAGAVAAITGIATLPALENGVKQVVPAHRADRIAANLLAVSTGFEWVSGLNLQPGVEPRAGAAS